VGAGSQEPPGPHDGTEFLIDAVATRNCLTVTPSLNGIRGYGRVEGPAAQPTTPAGRRVIPRIRELLSYWCADDALLDETGELGVNPFEPLARGVADPVQDEEAAQRHPR
jgi:hypothetical protein